MADQWEMCVVSSLYISFSTPKGSTGLRVEEFLKKYDPSFKSKYTFFGSPSPDDREVVICKVLSDGWEPYATGEGAHYFRRKYQG
jgi:hypothetical protein